MGRVPAGHIEGSHSYTIPLLPQCRQGRVGSRGYGTHRLKHCIGVAVVGTCHQPGATHQACTHVVDNVAVKIGHDHNIKLLGSRHQLWGRRADNLKLRRPGPRARERGQGRQSAHYLHGGVVHNHVLEGDLWVASRHLLAALQEEPITQLPREQRSNLVITQLTGWSIFRGRPRPTPREQVPRDSLHDVGLVHSSHFLAPAFMCQFEGILSDA